MVEMLLGSCTVVMPLPRNASIPICVTLWGITADFRCSVIMNACVPMAVSADGSNTSDNNDKDLVKYVSVGASYYFNKNMSTYVDYKINLLDNDDNFYETNKISTDDIVGVGLQYQF